MLLLAGAAYSAKKIHAALINMKLQLEPGTDGVGYENYANEERNDGGFYPIKLKYKEDKR